MQYYFCIREGSIIECPSNEAQIRVFSAPVKDEREEIIHELSIDGNDLDAALDPDEISRVEFTPKQVSVIWKQPSTKLFAFKSQFDVLSVGLFARKDLLVIILGDASIPFSEKIFTRVNSVNDIILRYYYYTSRQFLSHLKSIKQVTSRLEGKLSSSMENKYLLQMFDISESLVYYINAIEANGAVLVKLRTNTEKFGFTQRQINYLDDIIQENSQSARQANIYSNVLSGLMDARGSIVNNNMNVLLRNLTLINVIFLPLNLIAGMGGMSEFTMLLENLRIDWKIGYASLTVGIILLGWLAWLVIKRFVGGNGDDKVDSDK